MEVRVENILITALVWPMDNGDIIIWQTRRVQLDGLVYFEQGIGLSSRDRIESLIGSGIRSSLEKLSCRQDA